MITRREALVRLGALSTMQLHPLLARAAAAAVGAPRLALVIGNSRYAELPQLRNPRRDAAAFAERLGESGFIVKSQINGTRAQLESSIAEFCSSLAASKGVGLFYFAGHGLQLDWRNYLVPVDARISSADDVRANAIDLSVLLGGLAGAANPVNVVILDACRDNPFALEGRTAKGLSQMDAPVGTLLAYSTAPGNTASDGEGDNGLYTEHLLREMRAPDAKIEDVLKRVRLNVRRASSGKQVPWESTSLEADFYFVAAAQPKSQSQVEIDRRYVEELAAWTQIEAKTAAAVRTTESLDEAIAALEKLLQRYPSGHFSEIAQSRLDLLLAEKGERRARAAPAPGNPFTKGTAFADTRYSVGDRYEFQVQDGDTEEGDERRSVETITSVTPLEVVYNRGKIVTDLLGNFIVRKDGLRIADQQHFVPEYWIGKKWRTRYAFMSRDATVETTIDYAVVAREEVIVPAGRFDAFRIEGRGSLSNSAKRHLVFWIAPNRVRRPVAREIERWDRGRKKKEPRRHRVELVSFRERIAPSAG
jgi:uncharacterized caspase-like protein